MTLLTSVIAFTLISFVVAAPTTNDDDEKVIVTKSVYADVFLKYKGKHDIVNLLLPLNSLNFDEDESDSSESNEIDTDLTLFFVEADIQPDGSRIDQGLYVFKHGKSKKILEHGRDAAASADNSKLVFFGAKDGLYVYNQKSNSADKYGPVTDSIIGIAKEKEGDAMYILTETYEVFKVWNNGQNKEKIEQIINAKQIVLDYSNNLYFYSDDKVPYVYKDGDVKKIEGLPEHYSSVNLIKPPFIIDDSVPFVIDDKVYIIYANGSSKLSYFEFEPLAKPTAYAAEAALVQYYAYNKNIYEYNILHLVFVSIVDEIRKYLSNKSSEIRTLATKTKGNALRSKS